jgi:class I fructose-bisphosphate aldolase
MKLTRKVREILSWYEGDNPGTKANLARILMNGKLGGTGKMVILPVDQGFEHGPARSFAPNPAAYDPHYHFQLALDAGLNAFATPLGMVEAGADTFAGQVPLILKVNSANSLNREKEAPTQAITASVHDALRLGCAAIGYTMYPGSDAAYDMMEDLRELTAEAKAAGLAVVVWSYPRGGDLSKDGETGMDVVAYAAHMAALMGATIIKVKLPSDHLEQDAAAKVYKAEKIDIKTQAARVRHVMQSVSTTSGSWCSRAAPRKAPGRSMTTPGRSATAAATARSLGAIPSNARARKPSTCSTPSSASIRARNRVWTHPPPAGSI